MACNKENKKSIFIPSSEVISLLRFLEFLAKLIFQEDNVTFRIQYVYNI